MPETITNTFYEVYDKKKAEIILNNKHHFFQFLHGGDEEKEAIFTRMRKYYLTSGTSNKVLVKYTRKHNRGRQFAIGGLSLQSIPREIRGTIASEYYYDIDMVNAHPNIIMQLVKNHSMHMSSLTTYITARDEIINEILEKNTDLDYAFVKKAILSVVYGGCTNYNAITEKTDWMVMFYNQVQILHKKMKEWYPEEYELQVSLKGSDYFNLEGAVLSSQVCVIEDMLLEKTVNYLKVRKYITSSAVLTFDGIMILKERIKSDAILNKILKELERIYKDEGFDIKLKVKEFSKFDLDNIPESTQVETKEDTNPDAELDPYKSSSDYYWYDFMEDMKVVHNSLEELKTVFISNANKVMLRTYEMPGVLIRKISAENSYQFDKVVPEDVFKYWELSPSGKPYIAKISLRKLLMSEGLISDINCYDKLDFHPTAQPNMKRQGRTFNTWDGFKSKLYNKEDIDMDLIADTLNHIMVVWANNDVAIYNYIMSWFQKIFKTPYEKTKIALVLRSQEKQIGKGIIINHLIIPYIFGLKYAMSVAGLKTLTDRFNELLMNKLLINCDELSVLEGSYHETFDVLKKQITDGTVKIEIKGGKSFIYPDFSNMIFCTNNDFVIKLELGDARYCVIECNPVYRGNYSYFQGLVDSFNQNLADHFYSYVYHFEAKVEVRNIPMTDIRRTIMINSMSTPMRFLMEVRDGDVDIPHLDDSKLVPGKTFYDAYKQWCNDNNERVLSNVKFARDIGGMVDKKKTKANNIYDLNTIRISV